MVTNINIYLSFYITQNLYWEMYPIRSPHTMWINIDELFSNDMGKGFANHWTISIRFFCFTLIKKRTIHWIQLKLDTYGKYKYKDKQNTKTKQNKTTKGKLIDSVLSQCHGKWAKQWHLHSSSSIQPWPLIEVYCPKNLFQHYPIWCWIHIVSSSHLIIIKQNVYIKSSTCLC